MVVAAPAGAVDISNQEPLHREAISNSFQKFCSKTNNSPDPDCYESEQNWGFVDDEPEVEVVGNGSRPLSFEPIKPIRPKQALLAKLAKPANDAKEICFDKSGDFFDNCLNVEKKSRIKCILASDKVQDNYMAA
ncbi:hypothetical protein V2A60_008786 [Cordyceps javanica]